MIRNTGNHAALLARRDGLTDYERENIQTVPELFVDTAAKSLIDDLNILIGTAEGKGEGWADPDTLEALGVHDKHAGPEDNAEEEAQERLDEYPLCIEAMVTFEVVLGVGGPDSRILVECDRVEMNSTYEDQAGTRWAYEIRRVLYRYSWSGVGEVELTGDDREIAEGFARRVVPELAA